jgi:hypothetical protein
MKFLWLMSGALLACSNEAPVVDTTLTSAGMHVGIDQTIEQVANDRCNRQLSCGNIGKGHMWRDRGACEADAKPRIQNMIGCGSIEATRLGTCLNDIRDRPCAQSGDLPASCGGAQLCR